MSALGQKVQKGMSALPPESRHVQCSGPCLLWAKSGHTTEPQQCELCRVLAARRFIDVFECLLAQLLPDLALVLIANFPQGLFGSRIVCQVGLQMEQVRELN